MPNFLERTAGATPLVAGLAVAALTLGWPVAASNAGRLYLRFGFRPTVLIGTVLAALSALLLLVGDRRGLGPARRPAPAS